MTWKIHVSTLIGLCMVSLDLPAQDVNHRAAPVGSAASQHHGKAGIYLRPGNVRRTETQNLLTSHPLLDAVVLSTFWRDVEPARGKYGFDQLRSEVEVWGKGGKGVVIGLELYGQAVDDAQTPPWIYDQPNVRQLSFKGGGTAKGRRIRIPAVWDPGFVDTYVEPMVQAFAQEFDGHPDVWYVMPGFGHIGNVTCQPSGGGSVACLEAGWAPEAWSDYCRRVMQVYRKHFTKTPVFLKAAGIYIRDREHDNYRAECGRLLQGFATEDACLVHYGLEGDQTQMENVYRNLLMQLPLVHRGTSRIGLGDDWPLWVPENRRDKGPTLNHDDENLWRSVRNAFGPESGQKIPTTVLFCQLPEILASHPKADDCRPEVAKALEWARRQLKENDGKLSERVDGK